MIWLILVAATVMMFLGFEMFLVLGIPSWLIQQAYYGNMPGVVLIQKMIAGIDNSVLLAIPFFIFAAELMSEGRIAELLSRTTNACFRRLRGGAAYGSIGACMAFGSVCGSAPATVAALGRLMYPSLRAAGFREAFSLGLIVSAAETALLIPPSITLDHLWLDHRDVDQPAVRRRIGGRHRAGPGVRRPRSDRGLASRHRAAARRKSRRAARWCGARPGRWACRSSSLAASMAASSPPTEAAAVSVIYAVFVEAVVFRALTLRQVRD